MIANRHAIRGLLCQPFDANIFYMLAYISLQTIKYIATYLYAMRKIRCNANTLSKHRLTILLNGNMVLLLLSS